jgi:protein-L-isoaspartate(D-aspartate) O-methyltransferase
LLPKQEGAKVLDVGCGSGYLTACLAYMAGPSGTVVGIEHIRELVDLSRRNIEHGNIDLLQQDAEDADHIRVKFVFGDGRLGWEEDAPYDAIHVGAGSAEGVPQPLIDQLKKGGRLVCPGERL